MFVFIKRKPLILEVVFLIALTALVFLPFVSQLTYHRDDWYYILDRLFGGPSIFHKMFEIDRPLRGYFFETWFSLFGITPFIYHLGAYLWRLAACLSALWFFRMLWPDHRKATFFMALLLGLYPGYLWWVAGVEYQPMIASLALEVLSLALTARAVLEQNRLKKIALLSGSILAGWLYIGLVDYAIGMEALRFLAVFVLVSRDGRFGRLRTRFLETLKRYAVTLVIPVGFIVWKQFFFENERKATDLVLQLRLFAHAPWATGTAWLVEFVKSALNVSLLAWVEPFYTNFIARNHYMELYPLFGAALGIGLTILIVRWFDATGSRQNVQQVAGDQAVGNVIKNPQQNAEGAFVTEALGLGLSGVLFGILPVIVANRSVEFVAYSHYALPASLAAAILAVGLAHLFKSSKAQMLVIVILVGLAMLTHYGVGQNALDEEQSISGLWRQMAWRAPGIDLKTTFLIKYAGFDYGDDRAVVWGPSNYIYYPDTRMDGPVSYPLAGISFEPEFMNEVALNPPKYDVTYRTHTMKIVYSKLLVVSQPTGRACVHVIDERWPEISDSDPAAIRSLAQYSHIGQVLPASDTPKLPEMIFGQRPEHSWCYLYQKAELARQQGNWGEIARLAGLAQGQAFSPNDPIEWMPFLQAYAYLGDAVNVKVISRRMNAAFYKKQACQVLNNMGQDGYPLQPGMSEQVNTLFCGK